MYQRCLFFKVSPMYVSSLSLSNAFYNNSTFNHYVVPYQSCSHFLNKEDVHPSPTCKHRRDKQQELCSSLLATNPFCGLKLITDPPLVHQSVHRWFVKSYSMHRYIRLYSLWNQWGTSHLVKWKRIHCMLSHCNPLQSVIKHTMYWIWHWIIASNTWWAHAHNHENL